MTIPILVPYATENDDYARSLRQAGAEIMLVQASSLDPRSLWQHIRGIVLTGGPDVDPRLYNEAPDAMYDPAPDGRDAFEIELIARAVERDVPLLAICRGVQVLNVAAGGTLVQNIPTDVPQPLDHQLKSPSWKIAHPVRVAGGSLLAGSLGAADDTPDRAVSVAVNSRHHQAVKHVAPAFRAVASSDDGVIEAIERRDSRFCVGVQWHPENFLAYR